MAGLTGLLPGNTYGQLLYIGSGNVGIEATAKQVYSGLGIASPLLLSTTQASLLGTSARIFGMTRHTTPATDGNDLTINAGSPKASETDLNAGDLILSSGTSTGTGTGNIYFKTASAGASSGSDNAPDTKVSIFNDGSVGIGTSVKSSYKLEMFAGQEGYAVFRNGGNSLGKIELARDASYNSKIEMTDGLTATNIVLNTGGDTYFNGGNVGIGTPTPTTKFHLVDNSKYIKMSHNGTIAAIDGEGALLLSEDGASAFYIASNIIAYKQIYPNNDGSLELGGGNNRWATTYTNSVSSSGNSNRSWGMARHTTANTAGNNLTINAGGATSGATDKNGGDTYITSGIATGSGSSNIYFQTATAGASGTADRSPATKMLLTGEGALHILETTTPTAIANYGAIYAKTDNKLYFQDGAGTEHEIAFV
jgi:hypothetical protein